MTFDEALAAADRALYEAEGPGRQPDRHVRLTHAAALRCGHDRTDEAISFPRQEAATRRFRLGLPRAFTPAPDGRRVAFIRSAGGRDPVGSLWVAEADGSGGLDRAPRRRCPRARPSGRRPARRRRRPDASACARPRPASPPSAPMTTSRAPSSASTASPSSSTWRRRAAQPASCRIPGRSSIRGSPPTAPPSPSSAGGRCTSWPPTAAPTPRLLASPTSEQQSWGLADFVAAEELDRVAGCGGWPAARRCSPSTSTSHAVAIRWIADPAQPERSRIRTATRPPAPTTRSPGCSASASTATRTRDRLGPRRLPVPGHGAAGRRRRRRHQRPEP